MELVLRKYCYWSLALHLSAFVCLAFFPSLGFRKFRIGEEKIVWVNLPKGAADILGSPLKKSKGLPKTTIEEQKKALESPAAGRKKSSMTYRSDSRIENALARAQKEVAMKKAEPEAAQIPETQPGGFTFGTTTGPYVPPDDPEYVMYQARIRKRIMNEWIIPLKFTEQQMGLICKIVVHMNDRGEVTETEWDQKSGNPSFDMSALRAVEKASPLDIPPERLKHEVYNEGFIVEFNPAAAQAAP